MGQVAANMGVLDGRMTKHHFVTGWMVAGAGTVHTFTYSEKLILVPQNDSLIIVTWEVSIGTKGGVG